MHVLAALGQLGVQVALVVGDAFALGLCGEVGEVDEAAGCWLEEGVGREVFAELGHGR